MSETIEVPLESLNEWLTKETKTIVEPLRADAKKILKDLNSRLEELIEACDKLLDDSEKEMAKGSRKTYRRAKFLYKLAENFADLIEKITIPSEISGKSLNQTSELIKKTLKAIGQERTKWFRAISPYFIMSRRKFDVSLKRADDSFQNFNEFVSVEYVNAERAESVFSKVEKLRNYLTELSDYAKGKESRLQKKELLENKLTKTNQKMQAIQSKGEVVELAQLNLKIEELTETVKHEIRHLQKPLLKFQTLVNNPGYSLSPDATSKLDEYLTNPFKAMATENEGYPILKIVLQKIDTALDNKKMTLKSSRLRKAKDQINRIVNKSALVQLQKECSELVDKKRELLSSRTISESRNERTNLNDHLKDLQRQMRILEARDAQTEKQNKEVYRRVANQKKNLEKIVSELSDKTVKILLD